MNGRMLLLNISIVIWPRQVNNPVEYSKRFSVAGVNAASLNLYQLLLFCTALPAEFGTSFDPRATVGTELFPCQRLATFWTEFSAAHLCSAMWAGSDDRLLEFVGFDVADLGGFRTGIIDRSVHLKRGIFLLQIRRTVLA